MAQVIRITSEALQATIRRLLPSQQGFGEDLEASNVILPVVDVTPTAEGSQLPSYLQNAISFGAASDYSAQNSTVTLANTPGFYRVLGGVVLRSNASAASDVTYFASSGATNKDLLKFQADSPGAGQQYGISESIDLIMFLNTGEELKCVSSDTGARAKGSVYQIADRYGNLNNPSGFTFE